MNRRRRLLLAAPALLSAPLALAPRRARARPEDGRLYTLGLLVPNLLRLQQGYDAFVAEMHARGYREDRNLRLVLKEADGKLDRLPALARELVDAKVDLIVGFNTPGSKAAVEAAHEIPVVVTQVGDPVGSGFVTNLARPGGNVTGVSNIVAMLAPKRVALLKEAVPSIRRLAVLFNPVDPITAPQVRDVKATALQLGLEARMFPVREQSELAGAFDAISRWRADGAMWLPGQAHLFRTASVKLAEQHRLPLMVDATPAIYQGGLLSYSPDYAEIFRRTAAKVDRILSGARPGDLPIEQPTKLELIVNLKTARALGIAVPQSVLLRADRVIE